MSLTTDPIQYPGVVVSDDQDVVFQIRMEDETDLDGVPLLLTIRRDPDWPRTLAPEARRILDVDVAAWSAVITSTTTTTPQAGYHGAVVVPRASMAELERGRFRYVVEIARTDAGNISPVAPPTWLSVRPAVARP